MNSTDVAHLKALLDEHRASARTLEEQRAKFGSGEEPLELLTKISNVANDIRRTKTRLRALGVEVKWSTFDPPVDVEPFPAVVLSAYPLPIASSASQFNSATDDTRRFMALDRVAVDVIKYLAALFIGQARVDRPEQYSLPASLRWIGNPDLRDWTQSLLDLGLLYQQSQLRSGWRLNGLLEACTRTLLGQPAIATAANSLRRSSGAEPVDGVSVVEFLSLFAQHREARWGDQPGRYPTEDMFNAMDTLLPAFRALLGELEALRRYPLVYVERADANHHHVNLRMARLMGQVTEDLPPAEQPPLVIGRPDAERIRRGRCYVAAADGRPQIDLHPFFVMYRWELYELERHEDFAEYRSCVRGTRFRPSSEARTYYATWLDQQPPDAQQQVEMPPLLDDEGWHEGIRLEPFDEVREALPLSWLSPGGREAVELALGEALRIGRWWLGVEFLLMALSRQDRDSFVQILKELRVAPSTLRGALRGLVGVIPGSDWQHHDPLALGSGALASMTIADPAHPPGVKTPGRPPAPVVTPRMASILRDAKSMAGAKQIRPEHLLLACVRHWNTPALQLLLTYVEGAGWARDEFARQLVRATGLRSDDATPASSPAEDHDAVRPTPGISLLARYGRDLVDAARMNQLEPAEGDSAKRAINQIARTLLQLETNNPLIVGDPGVGKTAIVEGFAWELASRSTATTASKRIIQLSLPALMAGTSHRGELEERLERILEEVRIAKGALIVFLDEIHTALGSDPNLTPIANMLKPALGRGEFPCIGTTTVPEYRKHLERDPALARRFAPIWVDEPSASEATDVVLAVARRRLAVHHGVTFTREVVTSAVDLSVRHLWETRLPAKAIRVLDSAAAAVVMNGSLSGFARNARATESRQVTEEAVIDAVSALANIPAELVGRSDERRIRELQPRLAARVKGQDEAVEEVCRIIRRSLAGLAAAERPRAVLFFFGPTGVGKTALALALAEAIFDTEHALLRLDMSEFMEKHQVARLVGAPPGYVGSDEEGQLTGHLHRRPYSLVLLDEMEKAHPDVQHVLLQLFDSGRITDAHGRPADARNTVFIMTANADPRTAHFTAEFMNRLDAVIRFRPLDASAMDAVLQLELDRIVGKFQTKGISIVSVSNMARAYILGSSANPSEGARGMRRTVERLILDPLTEQLISGELAPDAEVSIDFSGGKLEFLARGG
jgi:ATP-dependent Clp protease ATP-binding subunit ClpC